MGFLNITLKQLLLASLVSASALESRAVPVCSNLNVKSNNGDRKVAIVMDDSGSMYMSDPRNLRKSAGRALADWLVSKKEASGSSKADELTVITFDDTPVLDYPLGDPAGASSVFNKPASGGGTFIAGGVEMARTELSKSGSGATADRSSIVVFTDGEDTDTISLVDEINNATAAGIRVSFGFLDSTPNSIQDKTVLEAIAKSGGVYTTITNQNASTNFINYVILNGLTKNDNPNGNANTLLSGLSSAHFISGSNPDTVLYYAQDNEIVKFSLYSVSAGILSAEASYGGKTVNNTKTTTFGTSYMSVSAPSAGQIDIKVTASNAITDSIYILGATSNKPIQNCTVGIGSGGGKTGLSTGAKAGLGVGIPLAVGLLGFGAFMLFKMFGSHLPFMNGAHPGPMGPGPSAPAAPPPGDYGVSSAYGAEKGIAAGVSEITAGVGGAAAVASTLPHAVPPPTNPTDSKNRHPRRHRRKNGEETHHHHLGLGHPCSGLICPSFIPGHICKDPNVEPVGGCYCSDPKCPLNEKDHECFDENYSCDCVDDDCSVTRMEVQRQQQRLAIQLGKMGIKEVVRNVC